MKKIFFLALMAFLWLPATTWADEHQEDPDGEHSGQVEGSDNEVWDDEQEEEFGKIVPSSIQLEYKILTQPSGTVGSDDYINGTVELEGIYSSSGTYNPRATGAVSVGALYIPHEIQVVTVDESYTATVNLYTVVGIKRATTAGIGNGAFFTDPSITSVTIPYTIQYIGGYAFSQCDGLGTVTVTDVATTAPSQLTEIDQYAFQNSGITSINFPETLTTIGDYAFNNCTKLSGDVVLPETFKSLGTHAFQSTAITSIVFPSSIATLGDSELQNCTSLTTVTMDGSTQLGNSVFNGCTSLRSIVLTGESPDELGGVEGTNDFASDSNITVYVPTGSAAAYLQTNWSTDVDKEDALSWNFNEIDVYYDFYEEGEEGTNYATYYTDAVGEFGTDVTPNIVTAAPESGTITYSEVSGYIPANTGLLLTVSSESAPTADFSTYYYHPYGVTAATATVTGNMLLGTTNANGVRTVSSDGTSDGYYFYKLSLDSDETAGSVGFYWGADNGAAFTSLANKAYLAVEASSDGDASPSSLSLKKAEDTTGIATVESASEKAASGIYTIQGVRVSNTNQPGLYIVDGKKVLVR